LLRAIEPKEDVELWTELTYSLRGRGMSAISAELPLTRSSAKVDGNSGGVIFFIDGDRACTSMPERVEFLFCTQSTGARLVDGGVIWSESPEQPAELGSPTAIGNFRDAD